MPEVVQGSIGDRDTSKMVHLMSAAVLLLLLITVAQGWQIASGMTVKSQAWEYMDSRATGRVVAEPIAGTRSSRLGASHRPTCND